MHEIQEQIQSSRSLLILLNIIDECQGEIVAILPRDYGTYEVVFKVGVPGLADVIKKRWLEKTKR